MWYKLKPRQKRAGLGAGVIEYVGHNIDGEGMHFSRDKLSEIAQYPTPINAKKLCSFFGQAQYFARHVENYVQCAEPMRAVLTIHDKSRKWVWSQAAETGFLGMQDAIRLCPKLYFVSDDPAHKIYLRTDALTTAIWGEATILTHKNRNLLPFCLIFDNIPF